MICLNMIVKNESQVIERCLASVVKWIDSWVIVDTGSTDGTQEIIKKTLRNIPGQLYERPWVDFSTNRNEALALAKDRAEYILFMDADDHLLFSEQFKMPPLTADCYAIVQKSGLDQSEHLKIWLVKSSYPWKWRGILHERLECPDVTRGELLTGVVNFYCHDGNRGRNPENKERDIALLEKAHREDPTDARTVFYLAQCYAAIRNDSKAVEYFQKRAAMGGWEEEIFYSLYQIGYLQERMGFSGEESYIRAHLYRPARAEPLFRLADSYIRKELYALGYFVAKWALQIPYPTDATFIEKPVYEYQLMIQAADCARQLERGDEAKIWLKQLLQVKSLPKEKREKIREIYHGYEPH
ncbi:MAG: glycosyltransferase [Verrucomicrobia bacterium]|nr:glycosyltransferase [Verrucomicrobiota bacterium]